jgi:2,7-dihydroxy-5-methyl-1-naphthoate 7-O-methyltransferase
MHLLPRNRLYRKGPKLTLPRPPTHVPSIESGRYGSGIGGLMDAYATAISAGLLHGVPLADLLRRGLGLRFAPDGQGFRFVQGACRVGRGQSGLGRAGLGGIVMTSGDETRAADSGLSGAAGTGAGTGQTVMSAWQALGPLMDLVTPMALRVAATLRLADFMPDDGAGQGAALGDLAERAGADPEALARMLRHLVQHGVFTEPRPGQFAANQTAALLRAGQPGAAWLDLDGFGGRMDLAFTGLLHTVRTGEPAWEQVFGHPFWAYLDANPAISASFDATMAVDAGSAAVADGYDWTTARHVADIGGGTGTLIAEVLRCHPQLHGTLAELPETAARARQYLAGLSLDGRCEVVGQSFFDPLPAGADVYLLSRVIHDWDDAAAIAILRRCAEAAGGAGRVLVIESHVAADGDPAAFAEMNLRMLVLAGGRERTIEHYSALAAAAGLRVSAVHEITERHVIIECAPPSPTPWR